MQTHRRESVRRRQKPSGKPFIAPSLWPCTVSHGRPPEQSLCLCYYISLVTQSLPLPSHAFNQIGGPPTPKQERLIQNTPGRRKVKAIGHLPTPRTMRGGLSISLKPNYCWEMGYQLGGHQWEAPQRV